MRIIHQTKEIGITDWLFIWTAFACICLNYTMYICSNYVYRYCICVNYLCTFMSYCASHEGNWHRWLIVHMIAVLLKKSKEVDTLHTYLYPFSLFMFVFYICFKPCAQICIHLMFILFNCLWNCRPGTRAIKRTQLRSTSWDLHDLGRLT